MAIFRISLGWITTPTFTQRCGALLGDAEQRHRDQQRHARRIERHREHHQPLRRHLRHHEHDGAGQQHVAAVVDEARAVVVARGIHGREPGKGQQHHGEGQKAVEAQEDGRDTARQGGLIEHGRHGGGLSGLYESPAQVTPWKSSPPTVANSSSLPFTFARFINKRGGFE
jgi:hypothetical protein